MLGVVDTGLGFYVLHETLPFVELRADVRDVQELPHVPILHCDPPGFVEFQVLVILLVFVIEDCEQFTACRPAGFGLALTVADQLSSSVGR